jgi:UDP:flavonoid glycosyltransferase YjiC (YdhE family)
MSIKEKEEIKNQKNVEKPLIGFFPFFNSLGEVVPLVKIAKLYMDQGGKAVFFSHGGAYENMAEDIGCKVIRLNHWLEGNRRKLKKLMDKGVTHEKWIIAPYEEKFIKKSIEEEIEAFNETGVKLVASAFNLTCSISARALKIPLVVIISGTNIPLYFESNLATFPENYENFFTKLLPESIKNHIANWYLLNNKMLVRRFNKFAKKYNVPPLRCFNDILLGDQTLVCDDIKFLELTPTKEFPSENYIGPIFQGNALRKQQDDADTKILNHLKKPGKSILLSMGSSGDISLFLKILEALNKTQYNVVAIYTNILNKNKLPKTHENILLQEFVPSIETILQNIDLAIIHGGRGTVYSVAYSGKPAIGIPMYFEQQYNLDNLVRHGAAIRLSKIYFNQTKFLEAVNQIFDNYAEFSRNAKILAEKLTKDSGEKRAVERLIEIINSDEEHKKKLE